MSENNSFNVVFNGGGGSGGSVDSASNVGSGTIEVFKQQTGSDLEFRTIQEISTDESIQFSYVEGDVDPLLNSTIEASVRYGNIAIRQADGWYRFFRRLSEAFASAVSGDVIEFFDDFIEERPNEITLIDGVDVNLNGFTYSLVTDDETNMFFAEESLTTNFRNGKLVRQNATQGDLDKGNVFYLKGGEDISININFNDCTLENKGRNVIYMSGDHSLSNISGGTIDGGGQIDDGVNPPYYLSAFLKGSISNMNFNVTQEVVLRGADATNLFVDATTLTTSSGGVNLDGVILSNSTINSLKKNNIIDGTINNCSFLSIGETTIVAQSSEFQNCTIEYKDAVGSADNQALNISGCMVSNSYVRSDVLFAVRTEQSFIQGCSLITTGDAYVVEDKGVSTITNCTIHNLNDNDTGSEGGIYLNGANSIYSNNTIIVSGSSNTIINGTPSSNAYVMTISYQGTGLFISGITNSQTTSADTFGNIKKG